MSVLIEKLQQVALYSDGIFISGQVVTSKTENKYFHNFYQRNPHYFHLIDTFRTKILRLTQQFSEHYLAPIPKQKDLSPPEILQRILWTSLILHQPVIKKFPSTSFKWGKSNFILDPFDSQLDQLQAMKQAGSKHLPQ